MKDEGLFLKPGFSCPFLLQEITDSTSALRSLFLLESRIYYILHRHRCAQSDALSFVPFVTECVLTDLADLLKQHLQNGDVVDLDNIGRFKLKVSSEAIDTPEEFNPRQHIKSYKCLFSPATDGKGNKPIYPEN